MAQQNKAALLYGPLDIRVETWNMPQLQDNDVLVQMECVGGSDVKMYTTAKCEFDIIKEPLVLGHEGAGLVIQLGEGVTRLKIGDRVAIEPTQPCRSCEYCKIGRYNLCVEPKYCSVFGNHGNLCKYYKHVADFCHILPDNLTLEEGAAVQPLAIAVHACNRAGVKLGSTVAILGAGPIGTLCTMTAKAMGAATVIIADIIDARLHKAKTLGANNTVLIKPEYSDDMIVNIISQRLGRKPDITIDACGDASAQRVALKLTKSGGVVLVVGIGDENVTVPLSPALLREVDIRGSIRFNNTYPTALEMVSNGAIDLKSLITHHFPFNKVSDALEVARERLAMKAIIHVQQDTN